MARTKRRPLPLGTLRPVHAVIFAFVLGGLALWVLLAWANRLAALVGMLSIAYYAVFLHGVAQARDAAEHRDRRGGGGDRAAHLVGRGDGIDRLPAVLLAAIVFFWTPPHFWALALYRREDYMRAGIPCCR
jgi:protoheme IX farnesyltransferase